jgi:hypothetical protein
MFTGVESFHLARVGPQNLARETKLLLAFMAIMSGAAQHAILDSRLTSVGVGPFVMHLETPRLLAPVTIGGDERAARAIPLPHLTPHLGGYVSRPALRLPFLGFAWTLRGTNPLPFEVVNEQRQRAVEDLRDVAVRDPVGKKCLRPTQLLVRPDADCHLYAVAPGRDGLGNRSRRGGRRRTEDRRMAFDAAGPIRPLHNRRQAGVTR